MAPLRHSAPDGTSVLASVFGQSRQQLDRAWEGFLAGAERESLAARGSILDSWERCRGLKVDLGTAYAPQLARDSLEAHRRQHRALLSASAETLAEATDFLGGTGALMLVTDADGIILQGVGDDAVVRAGTDIALGQGGNWCEGAAGTNGIGVALATSRATLVHAGEHYCARMKAWSCAAAPIIDPRDGRVAGILNLSARSQIANSHIFALAVLGAQRIQQSWRHQSEALRARLLECVLARSQRYHGDGMLALDAQGNAIFATPNLATLLHARLGLRLPLPAGATALSVLPADWLTPIHLDGELAGHMAIIPTATPRRRTPEPPAPPALKPTDPNIIVGDSPALRAAIDRATRFATADVPVLIEGETGVGKELFARAIHARGATPASPFVTFNCGAVSRDLIGSELFGYARGAFTGANAEGRAGRFELAHGGTLCLDEIGELPLDLQPYLLRVLEDGAVTRIGANEAHPLSVRVLAMTNRDLRADVAAGRFRRDLYHRLAVATVAVPPLRDRAGDLATVLAHFTAIAAQRCHRPPVRFTQAALARLHAHSWPGNVRELRNLVETATLLARDGLADLDCLPEDFATPPSPPPGTPPHGAPPQPCERTRILQAVAATAGNISMACAVLGMSRSTLYRRMEQHGLDPATLKATGRHHIRL